MAEDIEPEGPPNRFVADEGVELRPATQEEIDAVQKSLKAAVTRSEE